MDNTTGSSPKRPQSKAGIVAGLKEEDRPNLSAMTPQHDYDSTLQRFKQDITRIQTSARKRLKTTPPLLTIDDLPVFYPHTVNFIQGQAGVHKSRLAQNFAAAVIAAKGSPKEQHLGIELHGDKDIAVVYVDTERNMREQLPAAIQEIHRAAGFPPSKLAEGFTAASLINIPRSLRLGLIQDYVDDLRRNSSKHLLIFFDVITDCIGDFNVPTQAFELIDFMNMLSDQHNVTFICVIHENPGSAKARGHVGTELENKASTVLQIARLKARNEDNEEVYAIVFKKTRSSKRHDSLFVKFDEAAGNLVRCEKPSKQGGEAGNPKDQKLRNTIAIELSFGEPRTRKELCKLLSAETGEKEDTISKKLNKLKQDGALFETINGEKMLISEKEGKETVYRLVDPETVVSQEEDSQEEAEEDNEE